MSGGIVFFGGDKGGVGKSATTHGASLGAVLRGHSADYVLTDPKRKLRKEGRPYGVFDGRNPDTLASMVDERRKRSSGWTFIDGGGNRPAYDLEVAAVSDLCILLFRPSEEDLDTVADNLSRIPNAVAWPTAWPTNPYASRAAQFLIEGLVKAFPLRVIHPPIPFVNSVSELLATSLESPSTPVRHLARKIFDVMEEEFEQRKPKPVEQPNKESIALG
jgi:hypothetical protein